MTDIKYYKMCTKKKNVYVIEIYHQLQNKWVEERGLEDTKCYSIIGWINIVFKWLKMSGNITYEMHYDN